MKIKNEKTGKTKDVRLPKKFKEKWISALRSGEFEQNTDGYLQDEENRYCCLGVACKVANPKLNIEGLCLIDIGNFEGDKLKKVKVPSILKGSCTSSEEDFNPVVETLTTMNDNGKSFKVIANYIEKNL